MASARVQVAAPAKVNLCLHVAAPDETGLHPLASLVVFARGASDTVTVTPARSLDLEITGRFAGQLDRSDDNLVLKAARALAQAAGTRPRGRIHLDKRLPIASGIGGGSADAAATLRALNRLWGLGLDSGELARIAIRLGADVPVCLAGEPAWMTGYGEDLVPAPDLPLLPALLVNPGQPCPTGPVYRRYDARGRFGAPDVAVPAMALLTPADVAAWLATVRNDLEPAAIDLVPSIAGVLEALRAVPDVQLVRMSGSGATCFAVFDTPEAALAAGEALQRDLAPRLPDLWVAPCILGPGEP